MDPATGSGRVALKLAQALSVSVVLARMRGADVHLVLVIQRSSPAGELDAVTTDRTRPLVVPRDLLQHRHYIVPLIWVFSVPLI